MSYERRSGHGVEQPCQLGFVQVVEGTKLVLVEDLAGELESVVAVDGEGSEQDLRLLEHSFCSGFGWWGWHGWSRCAALQAPMVGLWGVGHHLTIQLDTMRHGHGR